VLTRFKSWLTRESPTERYLRHLEGQNERLVAQSAALLDRVLAREGFSPITEQAPAVAAGHQEQSQPFEDDEVLRERDERAEIEEKALLAATDPDYFDQVIANVESGDRRWQPVLDRAEQLMERAH